LTPVLPLKIQNNQNFTNSRSKKGKKKDRLLKKNCAGEEEIKETEFKTRSQYKRPNQTGDLEPKAYGVWIKKIPKKRREKKRKPQNKKPKKETPQKKL
jgi:hypothetical protein